GKVTFKSPAAPSQPDPSHSTDRGRTQDGDRSRPAKPSPASGDAQSSPAKPAESAKPAQGESTKPMPGLKSIAVSLPGDPGSAGQSKADPAQEEPTGSPDQGKGGSPGQGKKVPKVPTVEDKPGSPAQGKQDSAGQDKAKPVPSSPEKKGT